MGAAAGFSLLLGFGATIAMAKKHSPKYFAQVKYRKQKPFRLKCIYIQIKMSIFK